MNLLFRSALLTLLFLVLFPRISIGEGTRDLQPDSLGSSAGLYINTDPNGEYTLFAVENCPENYRLNIHIKEAGESILFGLKFPATSVPFYRFNLRKPDGTIAISGFMPQPGQPGYIQYYQQALTGPFPLLGGYNPLQYTVSSMADTGNYFFELSTSNLPYYTYMDIDYWDFQVVSGEHTPPVPVDMIEGRVWSKSWQVYTWLATSRVFNGRFFIYSDDGIVTKLTFSNARIGAATIFCNPYGCYNTGNFLADRQSVNTNTSHAFPGIADYNVFLNDPDSTLYPSGEYGEIIGTPVMIPDTAFPPCSDPKLILVEVSKSGNVDVTLTLPYGFPATTVNLFAPVLPGLNAIPWNGLDGLGNPIPDGTMVTIAITFADGLTNLPIWDQETNPEGFLISLIRPVNPNVQTPLTFWDDSQLVNSGYLCPVSPQSTNLDGCVPGTIPGYPGCHPWGLNEPDCHDKMINTWWYGSSSTATNSAVFFSTPSNPVGHGDSRCGPGIVTLHATVPPTSTVDWYDTPSGGTPLLAGDTTFLTTVMITTTFYAEARNGITNCVSPIRVPVVATVMPAPIPTINGPDTACAGTSGHLYQTEGGKNNYDWWLSSGGLITSASGSNIITVTWTEAGYHTVYVNYMDPNGCPASEPADLRVAVLPSPDSAGPVTGPSPVCIGTEGVVYMVEPVLWAQSYTWSLPPGFTVTSGAGTHIITVDIGLTATSGEITVYGTNLCGDGFPSLPYPVVVIQPPTAMAGPNDTICQGTTYTVSGATASGFSSLHWITTGTGILENAASLTPTYIPGTNEVGLISLTLITENPPCQADSSRLNLWIEVAVAVNAGPDHSTCYITPFFPEGATATHYQSIYWSTTGSGSFDNPTTLHPYYIPTIEDWNTGSVILTLTAVGTEPCTSHSDQLLLTFSTPPEGDAGPDGKICEGMIYQVIGAVANNFSSLLWEHNGAGLLENITSINPKYKPAPDESGEVTLILSIFGEEACSDSTLTDEMHIRIYNLEVEAGPDQEVDSGAIVSLNGMSDSGSGDYQISWEPAGLVVNPASAETVTLSLPSDTRFIFTVTDHISGCIKSDSLWVRVFAPPPPPPPPPPEPECLEIYNVITPNGDGVNDTWIITCIEQYPTNTVQILNRWGNNIRSFEGYDNLNRVWNGTNQRGESVPDGTYYYILNIPGIETKTGWVFVR